MSARREEILRELGLLPVWRLRSAMPAAEAAPTETPSSPVFSDASDERAARIAALDWEGLRSMVATCPACKLSATRTQTVFGVGDRQARWLFVGEAPGRDEDLQGEPFVGQAGKLLDSMLAALGMQRGVDVFIANVLKCRPPNNRNPEPDEVRCCEPYLNRQIALLQPKLIVALGKVAAVNLLKREMTVAAMRGQGLCV